MINKCKILVTGGAGYIGSHVCKILANAGYTPVVYDNLVYGHRWAVKWGPFEFGDIADRNRLNEVIRVFKPEAVMHFAAYAYVGESVIKPSKYYQNNVAGTLNLLEAVKDYSIDKFIFSSTCAIYGTPKKIPIPENHPQIPISPYGKSKLMIEQILQDYDKAYGIRSVSLRYFNAAGADPDGEIGESHNPETHLIPLVLQSAINPSQPIEIFGNDYQTKDGTCIRDYIHVTDLARAHVQALQYLENGGKTDAFNFGNQQGFSVLEVIQAANRITGKKIRYEVGPRRKGDPPSLVSKAERAKEILGWLPKYRQLEKQILHAWNWLQASS